MKERKNTQHLITSQCQHSHLSLLFLPMISPRSPTTLVLRGRGREAWLTNGRVDAASPPFPQERPAHISLVLLWFSLFTWICSLCSYFELNISNEKGCGLTCLIFPSLSCNIPPWPFSPLVVTPLPGFLLSVTLSKSCPEVHFGGRDLSGPRLSLSLSPSPYALAMD